SHAAGNSRRHSQPRTRPGAGRPGGQPWARHPDRQRDCHRLRPLNREGETAMSEANEESEISEGMGRMRRTAMAGGMQMRQAAARRQQAQQSQAQQADQQNQAQASKVATALRQDAYSREFWRTAGSERSEEHTSELQSRFDLVCRLLLEKKKSIRRRKVSRLDRV